MRHVIALCAAATLCATLCAAMLWPGTSKAGEAAMAGDIAVEQAWARASIGTERPGVAYLTLKNHGAAADTLTGVETPVAKRAEIHESFMIEGVMKMRPAGEVTIPPGAAVALEPGGLHVMLMFLQKELIKGEAFPLTLTFERAGELTVDVSIAGPGARGPAADHSHHDSHSGSHSDE